MTGLYDIPTSVRETWVLLWFSPDGDHRKVFTSKANALRWLKRSYEASSWNPILTHETTKVYSKPIYLSAEDFWKEGDDE